MSHTFKGRMTSVDGLRALAVVGVMTSHVAVPCFQSGDWR